MGVKFKNNAESTLAGGINASVTTLALATGEGNNFPIVTSGATDYFYCTIVDVSGNREIIKVTEHQSGDTFQVIERAADDSTAYSYVIGDKVQLRLPKIILEAFRDDIVTNTTNITSNDVDIAAIAARVTINETDLAGSTNPATVPAPSGTKMFFYQDTLPATWTIDTGPADSLLAVKGGAQAYNAAGGQKLGTWTPTGHTHTGPSHTHTGPSHLHTGPSHTHTMNTHTHSVTIWANNKTGSFVTEGSVSRDRIFGNTDTAWKSHTTTTIQAVGKVETTAATDPGDTNAGGTANTGSSGTGATGADGTGATGSSAEVSTDRPQAAVGTMGTKD